MVTCADTSFLFSLYGNDVHTPDALAWTKQNPVPVGITPLGEYELANALRFAEFRQSIRSGEAALFWADFEADCDGGRVLLYRCNLAEVLDQAKGLSAMRTLKGGHRSFDILHVASALVVGARQFLTFGSNQRKLARSEGLEVPL
jgi:predicted nucleic acid-binding protein